MYFLLSSKVGYKTREFPHIFLFLSFYFSFFSSLLSIFLLDMKRVNALITILPLFSSLSRYLAIHFISGTLPRMNLFLALRSPLLIYSGRVRLKILRVIMQNDKRWRERKREGEKEKKIERVKERRSGTRNAKIGRVRLLNEFVN